MVWEYRDNRIFGSLSNDDEELYDICERVETCKKTVNLLTGEERIDILLYTEYDVKPITLSRDEISEKEIITTLTKYGLTLPEDEGCATLLKSVITDTEKTAPIEYFHKEVGFIKFRGNFCFLGHSPIGKFNEHQRQSQYVDNTLLKPEGSKRVWRRMILTYVPRSPPLTLALALAVTSPVAFILQQKGIFTEIPLWGIIGESSTGKTTLLYLISSVWGNPAKFIENFDATSNAFSGVLKSKNGLPFVADEATYTPSLDWDLLLYSLPSGKDKLRCKPDGSLKPRVTFSGSVLMTSEKSIIERSKNLSGQLVRIIEFTEAWFKSGDEAEKIKALCSNNYGWGTQPLMELILSTGFDKKIIKKYHEFFARLLNATQFYNEGKARRVLQKFALILTAGWVFQKAVKIDIHLCELEKYLICKAKDEIPNLVQSNPADVFIEKLITEIASNIDKFPHISNLTPSTMSAHKTPFYGCREIIDGKLSFNILSGKFQEYVRKHSTLGIRRTCTVLAENNCLKKYYNDRYSIKKDFGLFEENCYTFFPPETKNILDLFSDIPSHKKNKKAIDLIMRGNMYALYTHTPEELDMFDSPIMKFGFICPTHQSCRIILNKELVKNLKLQCSDKVYLAPIPAEGMILLSRQKILNDAAYFTLSTTKDYFYGKIQGIHLLLKTMKLNIQAYDRAVFWDITILEDIMPIAIIKYNNESGRKIDKVDNIDPMSFEVKDPLKERGVSTKLKNLLSDED